MTICGGRLAPLEWSSSARRKPGQAALGNYPNLVTPNGGVPNDSMGRYRRNEAERGTVRAVTALVTPLVTLEERQSRDARNSSVERRGRRRGRAKGGSDPGAGPAWAAPAPASLGHLASGVAPNFCPRRIGRIVTPGPAWSPAPTGQLRTAYSLPTTSIFVVSDESGSDLRVGELKFLAAVGTLKPPRFVPGWQPSCHGIPTFRANDITHVSGHRSTSLSSVPPKCIAIFDGEGLGHPRTVRWEKSDLP
jgi:hypothetical protein